jgi:hypothetical protein
MEKDNLREFRRSHTFSGYRLVVGTKSMLRCYSAPIIDAIRRSNPSLSKSIDPLPVNGDNSFILFQRALAEYDAFLPIATDIRLDRHCHIGTFASAVHGIFMYRGVRGDFVAEPACDKERICGVARAILRIPREHVATLDAILADTRVLHSSGNRERVRAIHQRIDDKLAIRKILAVATACIDCEVEAMSILECELLQQVLIEESEKKTEESVSL